MLLSYPPNFVQKMYPSLIWRERTSNKELFLTFDDGPTPEITEKVLDLLSQFNAKASFFCLGKNIEKHPRLFERILKEGHKIGNHTFSHKNGWKQHTSDFIEDVLSFDRIYSSTLFRPPYGRLKSSQIKILRKRYKIVMWSILTQDYDNRISPEKCAELACANWENGSILVFHDSIKAEVNMLFALEKVLQKAKEENWLCCTLSE